MPPAGRLHGRRRPPARVASRVATWHPQSLNRRRIKRLRIVPTNRCRTSSSSRGCLGSPSLALRVEMSVYVVRAFVQLREVLASNKELTGRFAQLETRLDKKLTTHDEAIADILSAIRQLMHPPVPKRRSIGFTADLREKG